MRIGVVLILLLFFQIVYAQQAYRAGVLPGINVNIKLKNTWRLNVRTESRLDVLTANFGDTVNPKFDYDLTDISFMVSKRIGLRHQVAAGYLLRLESGRIAHRFLQQITFIQKLSSIRLAHRIFTDQTLFASEKPIFRLRYRIGAEIPLQGNSVDPHEFYSKFSNEFLGSIQSKLPGYENRIVPTIGYAFTDNNKLEWGLDYRTTIIKNRNPLHTFWLSINWFVTL